MSTSYSSTIIVGIFGTHDGCSEYGNEVGPGMGMSDLWGSEIHGKESRHVMMKYQLCAIYEL